MNTSDKSMLAGTIIGFVGLFLFTKINPRRVRQRHAYEKCGKILYMTTKA